MHLTFLLCPKHTSEEVNGTSMLILTPFLYSLFCLSSSYNTLGLTETASLLSSLLDLLIFPEGRELGAQPV